MEIEIENGSGEIYIGLTDLGSYFTFTGPIASTWFDCGGTLAKYLCVYNTELNNIYAIRNIRENIELVFSNNLSELIEILQPILQKLKSGKYRIGFIEGEKQVIFPLDVTRTWDVHFAKTKTVKSNENKILAQFIEYKKNKSHYNNLLDFTTSGFYDNHTYSFVATQPYDTTNLQTVLKYEEEIKEGKRPFAIVMSSYYQPDTDLEYPYTQFGAYEADWDSEKYIIDGHHKLLAYKNLGIKPNYTFIHQSYKSMLDTYFEFEEFSKFLYSWEVEHFIKNWESSEKYIDGKRMKY
jgi:hypothetical protein